MNPDRTSSPVPLTRELLRFAVAGVAGLVVDVALLYLALALGGGYYLGRALSFLCAVWTTWQINRRFTFADAAPHSLWRQWWQYLGAMLGGGAVNYLAYALVLPQLHATPYHLGPMLAVAVGSLAGMTVNFVSAKWLIFRRRR